MLVTFCTFQLERFWLKDLAFANILLMSVALETFQRQMFSLNDSAESNMEFMLVTFLTFQDSTTRRLLIKLDVTIEKSDIHVPALQARSAC
jgi:hypothetical protein